MYLELHPTKVQNHPLDVLDWSHAANLAKSPSYLDKNIPNIYYLPMLDILIPRKVKLKVSLQFNDQVSSRAIVICLFYMGHRAHVCGVVIGMVGPRLLLQLVHSDSEMKCVSSGRSY
mmetsp:Transcript_1690/g.2573  ORF Transcript_1690/g.2573 Transcript_1690/m.2573 type:complete len:117 (-) Transcript_1690:492-842(-)